jgi:hypothetical protein
MAEVLQPVVAAVAEPLCALPLSNLDPSLLAKMAPVNEFDAKYKLGRTLGKSVIYVILTMK